MTVSSKPGEVTTPPPQLRQLVALHHTLTGRTTTLQGKP